VLQWAQCIRTGGGLVSRPEGVCLFIAAVSAVNVAVSAVNVAVSAVYSSG
jgi:hypothetical protein